MVSFRYKPNSVFTLGVLVHLTNDCVTQNLRKSEKNGRHERRKKRTPERPKMSVCDRLMHKLNSKVWKASLVTDNQGHNKPTSRTAVDLHYHQSDMVRLMVNRKVNTDSHQVVWSTRQATVTCHIRHTTPTLLTASRVRSINNVSNTKSVQRAPSDRTAESQPAHY